jgi:hypothetical protein
LGVNLRFSISGYAAEEDWIMDFEAFKTQIQDSIPPGTTFENPGGGVSTIMSYADEKLSYVRGDSTIYIAFRDLFDAYSNYKGQKVSSTELKRFAPSVFDSEARPSGHSCNCTLFLMILQKLKLAGDIGGNGVRGNPFFVEIVG